MVDSASSRLTCAPHDISRPDVGQLSDRESCFKCTGDSVAACLETSGARIPGVLQRTWPLVSELRAPTVVQVPPMVVDFGVDGQLATAVTQVRPSCLDPPSALGEGAHPVGDARPASPLREFVGLPCSLS